ncbi:substrate-binding periplasmic protein [Candidatus Entotheonella palauensis]|nr:transporter substrate-binding domain-containing protein [Candidatus Entotheonella palauensis]
MASANANQISIVTVEWPPYFSKAEKNEGLMSQIVYRVMQEANLTGQIEFMPWKRAVLLVQQGIKHVLMGCYSSRDKEFYLSSKIVESATHFLVRKDAKLSHTPITSVSQLNPYTGGMVRGYALQSDVEKGLFRRVNVNKLKQLFAMLDLDRINLIIEDPLVARAEWRKIHKDKPFPYISIGKVNDVSNEGPIGTLHLCWSKSSKLTNNPDFYQRFELALQKLKDNGTYRAILKEWGL